MPVDLTAVERVPGCAKPDPVIVVDSLERHFGGVTAVSIDHLEIERGTITSLIGPNGAGKTTFFNLLTGFDEPGGGTWSLDGGSLAGIPSYAVARRGMVRTFQLTKSFARLTVLENVMIAAQHHPGERLLNGLFGGWRRTEADAEKRALDLIERFGLGNMIDEYAGGLSGGQRKLLEMARALMVDPSVVMLDEPMAGVNPALVESLLSHITGLADEGRTVVFIEHDMDVVMDISQWIVVLAEGAVISEGPPEHVANDQAVIDAYLGFVEDDEKLLDDGGVPAGTDQPTADDRRTSDDRDRLHEGDADERVEGDDDE